MTDPVQVNVRYTEFASSDPAQLRDVIDRSFGSRLQLTVPRTERWRATVRQADAGEFTVTSTELPADLTFTNAGHHDGYVVNMLLAGAVGIDQGKAVHRYRPGDTFLGTGRGWSCTVRSHDVRVQAITLPRSVLAAAAAGARDDPQPDWDFIAREPVADGARRWRDTALYAERVLRDAQSAAAPLVIGSVSRLLAATALAVFPSTALLDSTIEDRHDAHSATLRRAMAFVEEHAHEDIGVADIADACFVTVRAVQLAFRRHHDTTPLEYLRRVRLDHAHRELLTADPNQTTVTTVSLRWGFPSPSRFAAYYRRAYGVVPSQTLRRR